MRARQLICPVLVAVAAVAPPVQAAFTAEVRAVGNAAAAATVFKPRNDSAPAISGTPTERQTLAASDGAWSRQPDTLTRQWLRCDAAATSCVGITAATGPNHKLTAGDVGARLRLRVSASNAGGTVTVDSAPTPLVAAGPPLAPPASRTAPSISGSARLDQRLTADAGTWTGTPSLAYRWQRCSSAGTSCTDIAGAVDATFRLAPADVGSSMRVTVTATDEGGTATAGSPLTAVVRRGYHHEVAADTPTSYYRMTSASAFSGLGSPAGNATFTAEGAIADDPGDKALTVQAGGATAIADRPVATAATIELWFKGTSAGGLIGLTNAPPFVHAQSYIPALYVGTDGRLYGGWYDNAQRIVGSAARVDDGRWHHAALVRTASAVALYLDGVHQGTTPGSGAPWHGSCGYTLVGSASADHNWIFTSGGTGHGFHYSGQIDEVATYDAVLSPARLNAHIAAAR